MSSHHQHKLKRNSEVKLHLTSELKERLRRCWDSKQYPDIAKTFPDPFNRYREINFTSQNEFLEFIIRCIIKMGDGNTLAWNAFKHQFNPNYLE